jgi:putative transcriptional regulator
VISFEKAFELMKKNGLTTYKVRKDKIIGQGSLTKLKRNEPVTTQTIEKLCEVLKCQPGDLMEYIPAEVQAGE